VITAVFFAVVIFSNTAGQTEPNEPAAYYGFGEMEIIKLDWGIHNLLVADFNGDGRNDMAVVNNRKAKIEILLQKEAVGAGKAEVAVDAQDVDINLLSPATRFDRQSVAVSQMVYSLVCGDLNSDGMMDLAFYGEPKGLYVILQKASEGEKGKSATLNWQARKKIEIDDGLLAPNMLVCADLNNDGRADLALAARDAVYIILQKKDGTLAPAVKYPTAGRILAVEVGDLNGDGINDLVLVMDEVEKPIHVRFGRPSGQLGPEIKFFIEKPAALELANIDGIPGDEMLTVDAQGGRLICYKLGNDSPSRSASAEQGKKAAGSSEDWPTLFYPLESGEGDTKRDLVVGDFDGNGLPDVVVSDSGAAEFIFYKQIKGVGLGEPVRFPALADIAGLSAADCDYDGKTEVGVLSVKEKIIGISKFAEDRLSFPQPVEVVGEPVAMELADINGDGDVDCVYISKDANDIRSMRVIYNVGRAAGPRAEKSGKTGEHKKLDVFGEAEESSPELKLEKLTSDPEGIKVVDVDQDGRPDVLIFVKYEKPILVRQTAKGKFEVIDSPAAQASLIKDASLSSVAVADVDGRAGKELLIAQKNFARSLIFADGRKWSVVDQYNAHGTQDVISAVAAFDIEQAPKGQAGPANGSTLRPFDDAQGGLRSVQASSPSRAKSMERPAILLLDGQRGRLEILKAGEDRTYRFEKELDVGKWDVGAGHLKMLFAPLTGGEANSILLFDGAKFALITPPSGGAAQRLEQQFGYETEIKDGSYGNLTAGDINRDGRPDIVMVESRHNHIEILALDGQSKPIPAMRFKIFEEKGYREEERQGEGRVEPREMKIADVTGDGKADLVTVIHDRIIIYPQD
jgi:hypothetical protein